MDKEKVIKDRRTPEEIRRGDIDFNPDDPKAKSMTQQHFAEEVDINTIVGRALKNGGIDLTIGNAGVGICGDFSNVDDFMTINNKVIRVKETFERLPLDLRTRFNNSPEEYLGFLSDPKNAEEASNLGLLPKEIGENIRKSREAAEAKAKADGATAPKVQASGDAVPAAQ